MFTCARITNTHFIIVISLLQQLDRLRSNEPTRQALFCRGQVKRTAAGLSGFADYRSVFDGSTTIIEENIRPACRKVLINTTCRQPY